MWRRWERELDGKGKGEGIRGWTYAVGTVVVWESVRVVRAVIVSV